MNTTGRNFSKKEVLKAVGGSAGIMSTVARRLSCDWHTAARYCNKWKETKIALADESEKVLDLAEAKLYEAIDSGDVQSAKWLLSTKGKKRGFSERHEITGADGSELKITYEIVNARIKS